MTHSHHTQKRSRTDGGGDELLKLLLPLAVEVLLDRFAALLALRQQSRQTLVRSDRSESKLADSMDAHDSRLGLGGGGVVDLVDALLADGLVLRLVDLLARQVRLQQRAHPKQTTKASESGRRR